MNLSSSSITYCFQFDVLTTNGFDMAIILVFYTFWWFIKIPMLKIKCFRQRLCIGHVLMKQQLEHLMYFCFNDINFDNERESTIFEGETSCVFESFSLAVLFRQENKLDMSQTNGIAILHI